MFTSMCLLGIAACRPTQTTPQPLPAEPISTLELVLGEEFDEDDLVPGEVFINESELLYLESFPGQIAVEINGDLPTPCHQLEANIAAPDDQKRIFIVVFTSYKQGENCVQVLEPFEERISVPMEGQSDGIYAIWVNGENVGEFSYPR
ncbi:MAG: hypothetical protein DWQ07_03665 [Chloroflexi bacterium]|nr:MAG: hypothetical protein DWQ07_03665 [Chloroflexota bacterium]MBL1193400.1 hypothetical protein [Chloroflexota bacterium]